MCVMSVVRCGLRPSKQPPPYPRTLFPHPYPPSVTPSFLPKAARVRRCCHEQGDERQPPPHPLQAHPFSTSAVPPASLLGLSSCVFFTSSPSLSRSIVPP
mmetsp:Transcript_54771/g.119241  ORF Transcript_54771/g.119241 Transcript_54771/m.119241 type:complete len:100 (+) Transcript_54771:144-443(+)